MSRRPPSFHFRTCCSWGPYDPNWVNEVSDRQLRNGWVTWVDAQIIKDINGRKIFAKALLIR